MNAERSVLHVLPHQGGGGETYVDALSRMPGHRFTRVYLAPGPRPGEAAPALLGTVPRTNLTARRHDIVHVHGEVASLLCLPALAMKPSVVTLHGTNLVRRTSGLRHRAAVANLRLVLRTAGTTICIANTEYDGVIQAAGRAAARRTVVIRNGLELPVVPTKKDRELLRRKLGLPSDRVLGIWVGSLEQHKDPLTPVLAAGESARLGVPLTLLVAGEGSLRADLERAADSHHVAILGHRPDIKDLLAASDFFVASSLREGFGYALLEAMGMGLAPVVSLIPAHEEAAGGVAVTVPCRSVAGFAEAFARLAGDSEERALRGRAARQRVHRHFRAEEMVDATRAVYESVLAHSAGSRSR